MRKYWLPFVLALLLSASSGLYADVVLTDAQAQELNQTLDELETTLKLQDETLTQQQMTIEEQEKTISDLKTSYKRQNLFSILRSILISLGLGIIGFCIGIFI